MSPTALTAPLRSRRGLLVDASRLGMAWGACHLLGAGEAFAARAGADAAPPTTATVRQTVSPGRTLTLYMAVPDRAHGRHAAVLVAHGDHGLDENTRTLARHVARLGYVACAPDFLSRAGGTPNAGTVAALVRMLDPDQAVADALGTVQWLGRNPPGERVLSGRVGALGGGWGGALIERLATVAGGALAGGIVLSDHTAVATETTGEAPLLHVGGGSIVPDVLPWGQIDTFLKERLT